MRFQRPMEFTDEVHTGDSFIEKRQWVPRGHYRATGRSPQAVRVVREGQPPATLRLLTSQTYRIGRNSDSHLWFPHTDVSRLHGLLYFIPEISGWAFRDPMSTLGTFVRGPEDGEKRQVPHNEPLGMSAGQTLELAGPHSRLEFLADVPRDVPGNYVWRSVAGQYLESHVLEAARKQGPVLLFGPSGSGKTFLAQRIHELSRRPGPYVEINCGRMPTDATQFQSELLGHVKGAYTGAFGRRVGALFHADEGTLFLDEVESLPKEVQVFLLDLLEGKGELRPLGAEKGLSRPDVRFICATKVPLDESTLREDLVNRLVRGHRIVIPTLAERRADIPVLVEFILSVIRLETGADATVTDEAIEFLSAQSWPGHVRQLKDALYSVTDGHQGQPVVLEVKQFRDYLESERVVRGSRTPRSSMVSEALAPVQAPVPSTPTTRMRPKDMTREDVEAALAASGGVMKRAATLLGCSPTTLRELRRRFRLPPR